VLHRLADLGNTVIIIEHNLDVIRNADWILDLGPEGGEEGGRIVGQGRPAQIAATPGSFTGQFLKRYYTSTNGKLTSLDLETGSDSNAGDSGSGTPLGAPSFPQLLAEKVGNHEPPSSPKTPKPKRVARNTPAEDDLASTRAKAKRPAKDKTAPQKPGPRKKKTGIA
jgi:excinuclease ABC subunit A